MLPGLIFIFYIKKVSILKRADETVTIVQEKVPILIFSQISISPSWAYWGGGLNRGLIQVHVHYEIEVRMILLSPRLICAI